MTYEETDKLLSDNGWDLDCWLPLEISNSDGDRATGSAAQMIIDEMVTEEQVTVKVEDMGIYNIFLSCADCQDIEVDRNGSDNGLGRNEEGFQVSFKSGMLHFECESDAVEMAKRILRRMGEMV